MSRAARAVAVWTMYVRRPHALPISLATVSLPPAVERGRERDQRQGRVRRGRGEHRRDRGDAGVGEGVAGAAASAAFLGDSEQRLAAQARAAR